MFNSYLDIRDFFPLIFYFYLLLLIFEKLVHNNISKLFYLLYPTIQNISKIIINVVINIAINSKSTELNVNFLCGSICL